MEEMIDNTLAETGADEFSIFLSGENNFRYRIYPEYKANRVAPKPRHLKDLKNYLVEKYNAQVSDGCEADDLLGIAQDKWGSHNLGIDFTENNSTIYSTIICSIDKDLRMIPGWHYSFEINGKGWTRPMEKVFVEEFEGLKHFYTQCLIGDPTDNIKGVAGIGKVKAAKILEGIEAERELFDAVDSQYSSREEFEMNARCLWIWQKLNDDVTERWKGWIEASEQQSEGPTPTTMGS